VSNLLDGPIAAFDVIVLAVIVVSAIMSLGRGLVREASSVFAFIAGFFVALLAVQYAGPLLRTVTPEDWGTLPANAIAFVVGFLLSYLAAAFLGGRLSRLLHASPEIGVIDRLAGAAFGVARGLLACILFVLLMQQVLPEDATPTFVSRAWCYDFLDGAASWIRSIVPGFVDRAADTVTSPVTD
jgi:membrane protein required for colicin V production